MDAAVPEPLFVHLIVASPSTGGLVILIDDVEV
jgi:hypothetical protein